MADPTQQPPPLRILTIGDLHYEQRNLPQQATLATAIHAAIDHFAAAHPAPAGRPPLDLIVCLGDELDRHSPPPDVRGACVSFLRELSLRATHTLILVGNHTRKNNQISTGPDHTLSDAAPRTNPPRAGPATPTPPGVHLVEEPQLFHCSGHTFLALPYIFPPDFTQIMEAHGFPLAPPNGPDFGGATVAFAHQEITGALLNPSTRSTAGAHWPAAAPPMISGHLHERHHLRNVLYVGTPLQHSLGESRRKYLHFGLLTPPAPPGLATPADPATPAGGHTAPETAPPGPDAAPDPAPAGQTGETTGEAPPGLRAWETLPGISASESAQGTLQEAYQVVVPGGGALLLYQYEPRGLPTRHRHEHRLSDREALMSLLVRARDSPADHHTLILHYTSPHELVASQAYAALAPLTRQNLRIQTVRDSTTGAPPAPVVGSPGLHSPVAGRLGFGQYLAKRAQDLNLTEIQARIAAASP